MSSSMSAGGSSGSNANNRRRGVFSLGRYRLGSSPGSAPSSAAGRLPQFILPGSSGVGGVGVGASGAATDAKAVKYTPRGSAPAYAAHQGSSTSSLLHHGHGGSHDDELEEIAVVSVSGVQSGQLTYGSSGASIANGPRVVPGTISPPRGAVSAQRKTDLKRALTPRSTRSVDAHIQSLFFLSQFFFFCRPSCPERTSFSDACKLRKICIDRAGRPCRPVYST